MSWNNGRKNGIWPCLIGDKLTTIHEPMDTKDLYSEQKYEIMPSDFDRHTLQANSPVSSPLSAAISKASE